jgi:acetyltransferase-like isoleucine patch superfamily enzyme
MVKNILFNIAFILRKKAFFLNLAFNLNPIQLLRKEGATIGDDCRWMSRIYCSEPFLLTIGYHVSIGYGVQLITHEGATWVIRCIVKNNGLEKFGKITIGNNVFIGNNVIICPNITIGNNVIIGAGSIVTKNIDCNNVVVGSPAKVIKSVDEFCQSTIPECIDSRELTAKERIRLITFHVDKNKI